MDSIDNIGLIINCAKKEPIELALEVEAWLKKQGVNVFYPSEEASFLGKEKPSSKIDFCKKVDCILVLGGDGTFLRAARYVADHKIPILGINLGTLGFLTEVELDEIYIYLSKLLSGEFEIETRSMLSASIKRASKEFGKFLALNDFVIYRGSFSRLINLDIYLEDDYISSYSADGIIVATPTGSTAYSLSAGGPIVYPNLDVNIITPICPHSLTARPMIVPPEKTIKMKICDVNADAKLTLDGQFGFDLEKDDILYFSTAKQKTSLIRIKDNSFFGVLRKKLNLSGDHDE